MSRRVSPTERIRAQIDELFAEEQAGRRVPPPYHTDLRRALSTGGYPGRERHSSEKRWIRPASVGRNPHDKASSYGKLRYPSPR